MVMRKLCMMLAGLLVCVFASAQDIKVQAPDLVGVNEQFNVTFVVEGESSHDVECNWNPGSDFKLVWGPTRGSSSSTTIINGKRTRNTQVSFTYVLMPGKTGYFTLPQAEITIRGKSYKSPAHSIEVVADKTPEPDGSSSEQAPARTGTVSADDLYMQLQVSKRNVMVGEPVTATLKIYQRVNIRGYENASFPDFHGFWSQETFAPNTVEFRRENVNGHIFNVATLRVWTLIPQQSGELVIDPAELVCLVSIREPRQSTGSIFDDFFQDDYRTIRKRVTTDPVRITVSGLPQGAPASFGGGVGKYAMSVSLSRDSINIHDAASLKVSVSGTGNVALIEAPSVNFPPDFEVYDVKTSEKKDGKVFEYPFIARSHGRFEIPAVEYSYYDVQNRKYVTLKEGPLSIDVGKGAGSAEDSMRVVSVPGVRGKDVKNLASDIRYISVKAPALDSAPSFFIGTAGFWVLVAAMLLLAAAAYFVIRLVLARRADVSGSRTRTATKMAHKRLARADAFLKKELYSAFYEELHKALLGYTGDKLGLDASDLNRDTISGRLAERNVPESLVSEYIALLDECEYARYSPDAAGNAAMSATYDKAVAVISGIDDNMKKKNRSAGTAAMIAMLVTLGSVPAGLKAAEYPDSLWNAGVEAYSEGRWSDAAGAWTGLLDLGIENAPLFYNLGNAYYKMDECAGAILWYERALKIDPSYDDAACNLEFARAGIQDKIAEIPPFFMSRWIDSFCRLMRSDSWTAIALVLLLVCLLMVLLFVFGHSRAASRTGFSVALTALVLSLVCFAMAGIQKSNYYKADSAIVMSAVCPVRSAPSGDNAKDLFVLHEGTKVKLLDTVGDWLNVELSDGRQGWIRSSELEII